MKEQISDPLERMLAEALTRAGIEFEMDGKGSRKGITSPTLDFALAEGIYIEVKAAHTPRVERQLAQADNVILVQGKRACAWLCDILDRGL